MSDLEPTELPVRPKAVIGPDDVAQPRRVEWGHLSQIRGHVEGDRVRVERQERMHSFERGMCDNGRPRRLFAGDLDDALAVYRALDALFDGGDMEGGDAQV